MNRCMPQAPMKPKAAKWDGPIYALPPSIFFPLSLFQPTQLTKYRPVNNCRPLYIHKQQLPLRLYLYGNNPDNHDHGHDHDHDHDHDPMRPTLQSQDSLPSPLLHGNPRLNPCDPICGYGQGQCSNVSHAILLSQEWNSSAGMH